MNTRNLRPVWLAAALILPVLAGCSRQEPETPAASESNAAEIAPLPAPIEPEPSPLPTPTPTPSAVNPEAEPIAADEQMMDDAAATGMTARSERGEAQPADTGSAAEEVEAK
ncbi:MAG TPA: hypothetical protein VM900_13505 [Sphingomonas sp.]|jgi:hypothetical protein|nr:hypothetical protein [Sphingomonas sp.]